MLIRTPLLHVGYYFSYLDVGSVYDNHDDRKKNKHDYRLQDLVVGPELGFCCGGHNQSGERNRIGIPIYMY